MNIQKVIRKDVTGVGCAAYLVQFIFKNVDVSICLILLNWKEMRIFLSDREKIQHVQTYNIFENTMETLITAQKFARTEMNLHK